MASAKLVVTKARGGTKISLIGTSGTELLTSKVFTEPRGKGATMRALKGLLGEGIVVDDQTVTAATKAVAAAPAAPVTVVARTSKKARRGTKAPARRRSAK
jgi:hypothetical protein